MTVRYQEEKLKKKKTLINMTNTMPRALNTSITLGAVTAMKNTKTDFVIMVWMLKNNSNYVYYILHKEGRQFP